MIGSIIGDIVGSRFEFHNTRDPDFDFFHVSSTYTDDSVLTVATADAILNSTSYLKKYQSYYLDHPNRGWGGMFDSMARTGNLRPYNSYGNGSAMRIAPIGWAYNTQAKVEEAATRSASATHNHPEGIKGAKTVATAVFMGTQASSKDDIVRYMAHAYGIDSDTPLSSFSSSFNETCQGTVPICMALFRDSVDYEDAIRKSILHGGDVDTIACIVGGIAEAHYGRPPQYMIDEAYKRLHLGLKRTATTFLKRYCYVDFEEPTAKMNEQEKLQDALRSLWT